MKHILALLRRDGRRAYANAITIVVMAGIIAVPSFYAWFNIAGSWDPYANTRDLKVAVANTDAGYDGELVPVHVNLGERVVAELLQSAMSPLQKTRRSRACAPAHIMPPSSSLRTIPLAS